MIITSMDEFLATQGYIPFYRSVEAKDVAANVKKIDEIREKRPLEYIVFPVGMHASLKTSEQPSFEKYDIWVRGGVPA